MSTRLLLLSIFSFVFLSGAAPVSKRDPILSSFTVHAPSRELIKKLASEFEIEHRRGDDFEVIVPATQADRLISLAPHARLAKADLAAAARAQLEKVSQAATPTYHYHRFDDVQAWMKGIEKDHPAMAQVIQYGTSQRGLPLLALRLSKNLKGTAKPELMITAATHGDELITTEVLMSLIDQMITGYGSDSRFTAMIDQHELYFIPVVNPDGFTTVQRYDNGADPNRSYPYPDKINNSPTASIDAVMKFFEAHQFVGSIDFHAYGGYVMYPWGYTQAPIADAAAVDRFEKLTSDMASTNNSTHGAIADVLYTAPGSSCDYYFWKKNSVSLGIEIGQEKIPSPAEFPDYIQSQTESTWRFIESF